MENRQFSYPRGFETYKWDQKERRTLKEKYCLNTPTNIFSQKFLCVLRALYVHIQALSCLSGLLGPSLRMYACLI